MEMLIDEWRKMSLGGKVARLVSWVVYWVLTVMALLDVGKREPERIRGKKLIWTMCLMPVVSVYGFALPVPEVVYFLVGRKK
jgi:hypothetical protein